MCANLDLRKINYSVKLRRFDTYMSVYKEYDQRQWSIFVECDLIGELNKFLRRVSRWTYTCTESSYIELEMPIS